MIMTLIHELSFFFNSISTAKQMGSRFANFKCLWFAGSPTSKMPGIFEVIYPSQRTRHNEKLDEIDHTILFTKLSST